MEGAAAAEEGGRAVFLSGFAMPACRAEEWPEVVGDKEGDPAVPELESYRCSEEPMEMLGVMRDVLESMKYELSKQLAVQSGWRET